MLIICTFFEIIIGGFWIFWNLMITFKILLLILFL